LNNQLKRRREKLFSFLKKVVIGLLGLAKLPILLLHISGFKVYSCLSCLTNNPLIQGVCLPVFCKR
jgi:hypothetical protein